MKVSQEIRIWNFKLKFLTLRFFRNFKTEWIIGEVFCLSFTTFFTWILKDPKLLKNLNLNPKWFGLFSFLEEINLRSNSFQDDSDIELTCEMDEKQLK